MKEMKKKMKYNIGKKVMMRGNMMPGGGGAKKNKEPVIEMEQARVERMYGGGKVK
tara:strand:- start:294 stop:458 length:165 start_codon:yes stop_codon:yes gene_type:complete